MKLERKYNLVFMELKPLFSYFYAPISDQPISNLIFPTLKRKVRRPYRPSRDYLRPRSDSAQRWHDRSRHLGPRALERLVYHARNVKIQGIPLIKCEWCATAHAKQVVSRRPSEHRSPRPFWRVAWDLFEFEKGYNRTKYLFLIKDEYSGKLFGFTLTNKEGATILRTVKGFERWVRRQYGLSICVIKHDNDTSVIHWEGATEYMRWAKDEGIELELSPTYTHESNGLIERAGQEVITRSIKVRESANLPAKLWPESTLAVIYLYNRSPSDARPEDNDEMTSPDEMLANWFRNYFRWYDPQLVNRITADLRPNWEGIYVYGARAYPLKKEREADKERKAFKVNARGHIGYLVGYHASNIYRIWIPKLDRVIISRNVRFDEDLLYNPDQEKAVGQPLEVIRSII